MKKNKTPRPTASKKLAVKRHQVAFDTNRQFIIALTTLTKNKKLVADIKAKPTYGNILAYALQILHSRYNSK